MTESTVAADSPNHSYLVKVRAGCFRSIFRSHICVDLREWPILQKWSLFFLDSMPLAVGPILAPMSAHRSTAKDSHRDLLRGGFGPSQLTLQYGKLLLFHTYLWSFTPENIPLGHILPPSFPLTPSHRYKPMLGPH